MQEAIWLDDEVVLPESPEKSFLIAILLQTILDAQAIAKKSAYHFTRDDRYSRKSNIKANFIRRHENELLAWIASWRFAWYCRLLGFNATSVVQYCSEVARGKRDPHLAARLRKLRIVR